MFGVSTRDIKFRHYGDHVPISITPNWTGLSFNQQGSIDLGSGDGNLAALVIERKCNIAWVWSKPLAKCPIYKRCSELQILLHVSGGSPGKLTLSRCSSLALGRQD